VAKKLPAIGIIGSGPVGQGIATLLAGAGYRVVLGTRNPAVKKLPGLPSPVAVGTFEDAAAEDVVFIAIVHSAAEEVVTHLRHHLAGKVLIDTMNAWIAEDYTAAGFSADLTEGSWLARLLPETAVTRAFSHIHQNYMVPRATHEPGVWAAAYAADDPKASEVTAQLIRDMGYVPVLVGTLAQSAPLDVGGVLWPCMLTLADMKTALAGARQK
jgi:predicted dinucleotide-binding enzyme